MKLAKLLIVTCWSIVVRSETTSSKEQTLEERASAQLERLSAYRRTSSNRNGSNGLPRDAPRYQSNDIQTQRSYDEQRFALEFFQLLPRDMQEQIIATKRIDSSIEDRLVTDVLADPRKAQMMQDRIKRSGSGSFVSNIAGGIVGGIANAAAGASKGSSTAQQPHSYATEYGVPTHTYEHQKFDIWDFKRAILNTLFQALKAISGGVLALKGQIIKGSGYLISTKGRLISSTGDVLTSLGRQIASSAVVSPPKTEYSSGGYSYDPPISHEATYDGPPSGHPGYTTSDDYTSHTGYSAPSDVDDQAGLLIVKPNQPELDAHENLSVDLNPRQQPNLSDLEASFGGPSKDEDSKDLLCNLSSASSASVSSTNSIATPPCVSQENQPVSYNSFEHPPPNYNSQNDYYTYTIESEKNANGEHYQSFEHTKNSYQADGGNVKTAENSYSIDNGLSIQQSVEYPPFHSQQLQYLPPQKDSGSSYLGLPKEQPNNNLNPLTLYPNVNSLKPYTTIQVDTIKLPILNLQNLPNVQKHQGHYNGASSYGESSLHEAPSYGNSPTGHYAAEPLKIPILNPIPEQYWQTYAAHTLQKRNGHSRRGFVNKVKRTSPYIYYDRRLRRA